MVEDHRGFRYPAVDYNLCNQCGLCDSVCAFKDNYGNHGDSPAVYALKHRDEFARNSSTSGGMFTALSDAVLEDRGVIYGVGYGEKLYVCHKRAVSTQQRDEFRGSKYVQSDTGDCFTQIKQDLDNGLKVLFTGTPCQAAALNSFLKKDYQNLITVDIICHGTPSNKIWREFLDVVEKDTGNKVRHVQFRSKANGWSACKGKIYLEKGAGEKIRGEQSYLQLFYRNYTLMPSCYNCKFTNFKRPSDITLGDFWGLQKSMPEFDDDKGVSLVLVNSARGEALFDRVKKLLDVRESCKEMCQQPHLNVPPEQNKNSDRFWSEYHTKGIRFVMAKYTEYGVVRTVVKKAFMKVKLVVAAYFKKIK